MSGLPSRLYNRVKKLVFPGPAGSALYKIWNWQKQKFKCPLCNYQGPFYDVDTAKHEHCPRCGANERTRLQYLVIEKLRATYPLSKMSLLHFAPEDAFVAYFRGIFQKYTSADLVNPRVDHQVDLLSLPFDDQSYDLVFASHVLEHIKNDEKALSEIRRVLRPGGIAILPVPIVSEKTIEYAEPNPEECGHVRAPGHDYFERYALHFSKVDVVSSIDFPSEYQLFNYEDRTNWPTKSMPLRQAMSGDRHLDYVPVCYV